MINYIKAEAYRVYTSLSVYILLGIFIVISSLGNFLEYFHSIKKGIVLPSIHYIYDGLSGASIIIFFAIYVFSVIVVYEYSKNTFKNIISSELSRKEIYLGKLITINIVIISMYLMFIIINTIMLLFLYKADNSLNSNAWVNFIKHIVFSIPLFMGLSSLGCFMAFLLRKDSLFSTIYIFTFAFIDQIMYIISLKLKISTIVQINNYTISTNLRKLSEQNINNADMIKSSLVGVGFIIVFGILGYLVFRKQDIK